MRLYTRQRTAMLSWIVSLSCVSKNAFGFQNVASIGRFYSSTALNAGKKVLVLGGTGFLGQEVCKKALEEGYSVVSLSRRGLPPTDQVAVEKVEYRMGDARQQSVIAGILNDSEEPFAGVVHCVGLLFDDQSGLGNLNRFVSGSGSVPDSDSTYYTITRITAFNAIDATSEYAQKKGLSPNFPFVFTSAAEAGWPDMAGGSFVESNLAPDFLKRYLAAKRAVEEKLSSDTSIRSVIARPSLIYSMDRPGSFPSVGAFFVGNAIGLPFVDRPVTVQDLASAMVRAIGDTSIQGTLRYKQIDDISTER